MHISGVPGISMPHVESSKRVVFDAATSDKGRPPPNPLPQTHTPTQPHPKNQPSRPAVMRSPKHGSFSLAPALKREAALKRH